MTTIFTRNEIKKYLIFAIGSAVLAFGLYNIHSRTPLSEGGVLGLSLLIYHWFGLSPGISCFIMDMSALALGTFIMGGNFLKSSVIASSMYAAWYLLFENIGPMLPDFSNAPFIAAVLGGVFIGVGCGMIVAYDCAAGADDAMAISLHKLTGIDVGKFYILNDLVVLLLSLSYIPFSQIGWSLVSVVISSSLIDVIRRIRDRRMGIDQ